MFILKGANKRRMPNIKVKFVKQEPIKLPKAKLKRFFLAERNAIENSGKDVEIAKKVAPKKVCVIFNQSAISEAKTTIKAEKNITPIKLKQRMIRDLRKV